MLETFRVYIDGVGYKVKADGANEATEKVKAVLNREK